MNPRVLTLDKVAGWSGPALIPFVGIDTGESPVPASCSPSSPGPWLGTGHPSHDRT
jgi:hypothetical protein